MAPRAIASADIYFKLLRVPVKVHSATVEPPKIAFNQLHAKCQSRLSQVLVCPGCAVDGELGPKVEGEEIVKAFQVEKDRYVTFTPEEMKALEETPNPRIDIDVLVPVARIDPIYWSKPYYLSPDGSSDAYATLADILRLTDRVALAQWSTRGKQLFVALRFSEGRIVLQQLLRAEEVRPIDEVPAPPAPPAEAPLQLGLKLADLHSVEEFRPEDYPDEVYARTTALIAEKIKGKEITAPPALGKPQVVDLMEALAKSIAERRPPKPASREEGASKRRPPKRAAR